MTRIDLRMEPARSGSHAFGAGFVALDIVEGRRTTFAAAGGSCGNVMTILAWMGWQTHPAGRLGHDNASDFIVEELQAAGVDTSYLVCDPAIATPIVIQKFVESETGHRTHRFSLSCPDCRGWLPRFRAMTLKQAAPVMESTLGPRTFYFDRVTPSSLRLAKWAQEAGALIMFEPASVNDERAFQRAIDVCHILKYSDERLGHIPDLEQAEHPWMVVKTLGADGLLFRWENEWTRMPAFEVPAFEDAAGSGDWCSAGILHYLVGSGRKGIETLHQSDIQRAVRFGQALAALNCKFEGARGLMSFLDYKALNRSLRSLVASGKPTDVSIPVKRDTRVLPRELCELCSEPAKNSAGSKSKEKHA